MCVLCSIGVSDVAYGRVGKLVDARPFFSTKKTAIRPGRRNVGVVVCVPLLRRTGHVSRRSRLLRNHLALGAAAAPLIVLRLGLTNAFCDGVASDVYWSSRQSEEDFITYKVLRQRADETYGRWARREVGDVEGRDFSRSLSKELRAWDDGTNYDFRVFTEDHWGVLEQECAPFRMFSERLGILESSEERSSEILDCNYLVFTL